MHIQLRDRVLDRDRFLRPVNQMRAHNRVHGMGFSANDHDEACVTIPFRIRGGESLADTLDKDVTGPMYERRVVSCDVKLNGKLRTGGNEREAGR